MLTEKLLSDLIGKGIKEVTLDSEKRVSMTFSDGTMLALGVQAGKLTADVNHDAAHPDSTAAAPTKRQLEYLLFIAKKMRRFGGASAKSDIERHFLVSAPSVNQMMQTLERRAFISRWPGVLVQRECASIFDWTGKNELFPIIRVAILRG